MNGKLNFLWYVWFSVSSLLNFFCVYWLRFVLFCLWVDLVVSLLCMVVLLVSFGWVLISVSWCILLLFFIVFDIVLCSVLMFVNGCLFVVILVIYGECLKIFDSVVINVFGVIVFSCFNV